MKPVVLTMALLAAGCVSEKAPETDTSHSTAAAAVPAAVISVYKSPTCGCCKSWVARVQEAGFRVETHDMANMDSVKNEAGVPSSARSCHTGIVDGYVIEGHVPPETIARLLRERPKIAGLAVPGMPIGAPGMEVPGRPADSYDVVAIGMDGATTVYERH